MAKLRLPAALLSVFLLAGCVSGYDIDRARMVEPGEGVTPFNAALTQEYRDLMIFEADEMFDWIDAQNYALKALAAASGESLMPEELANWHLPADKIDEMSAARADLLDALNGGGRVRAPNEAAHAQAMFDCWVEQQEENHQPEHIAACRDDFYAALEALKAALAPAAAAGPATFVIYFDFDSSDLRVDASDTLKSVLSIAQTRGLIDFSLTGHADRAGPADYNETLSLRRAEAVREALVAKGILSQNVSLAARGESQPAVPTDDGVRDQRNRRVEIILQ